MNHSNNEFEFSALPGGFKTTSLFLGKGLVTKWLSMKDGYEVWLNGRSLKEYSPNDSLPSSIYSPNQENQAYYIRCIQKI